MIRQNEQSFWSFAITNKETTKNEIVEHSCSFLLYCCIILSFCNEAPQNHPVWSMILPFHSHDRNSNSPYRLPYNSHENFREFVIRSTNIPLIDIFLNSHHLCACCIDNVRRNSVLITPGS